MSSSVSLSNASTTPTCYKQEKMVVSSDARANTALKAIDAVRESRQTAGVDLNTQSCRRNQSDLKRASTTDRNFEAKTTSPKTNSSSCFGIMTLLFQTMNSLIPNNPLQAKQVQHSLFESPPKYSESYDRDSAYLDWNFAHDILKEYPFQENDSVIEVGGICGRVSANIAGLVPKGEVIVTEVRGPNATQFANQKYPKSIYPNLSFLNTHILDSDYENRFNLACCFTTFDDNTDQPATIQKIYQALKPGGHFIATVRLMIDPEMGANIKATRLSDKWKGYYSNYNHPSQKFTPDEYRDFLTKVGFKDPQIKVVKRHILFENKRAFMEFYRTHPIGLVHSEDRVEEFLTDLVNSYAKQFGRPDGQIPQVYEELVIHATK